jgi:hypothetical protein
VSRPKTKRAPKRDVDAAPEHPTIRDRIAGLIRLPKSRLRPNPRNWRLHPEQQRLVLRAVLGDIGVVDALLVRPVDPAALAELRKIKRGDDVAFHAWAASYKGLYILSDGHMRLEEIHADEVPALVLDIDEREETEVLATLDPITAMATTDTELLSQLASDLGDASDVVVDLIDQLTGAGKEERGTSIQVVDTTKIEVEFYMSVRGPVPAQPEAIERLRKSMNEIPGVVVEVGLVG